MTHPIAPTSTTEPGAHSLKELTLMDPDIIAFQAAKKVAAAAANALQHSTHSCSDIRIARSSEFKGVWGVELHATRRDTVIDSLMLMNDARYVTVNGDNLETHGCVAIRTEDGAISHVPCIISYPLVTTDNRK